MQENILLTALKNILETEVSCCECPLTVEKLVALIKEIEDNAREH